jgi:hypothetical protein
MPLNYLVTGNKVQFCRFTPAAGVPSVQGVSATQNVHISHSVLSATGIGGNISNTAGATPTLACNVLTDG